MSSEVDELTNQIESMSKELELLSATEEVKRYNLLRYKKGYLIEKRDSLYKEMKIKQFETCNHIWISNKDYGKYCIKCNLNTMYNYLEFINYDSLDMHNKIVLGYFQNAEDMETLNRGTYLNYDGDIVFLTNVYKRIKKAHPNAKDHIILNYLNAALYNMNNKSNNPKRVESRIKRLSLDKKMKEE